MIVSFVEIVILSLIFDWVFRKLTIPGLIGMLLLGIIFGPNVLGWMSRDLLDISGDFRLIALIIIFFGLSSNSALRSSIRSVYGH